MLLLKFLKMKNRYYSIFFILLSFICYASYKSIKAAKAQTYNLHFQKKNFSSITNGDFYQNKDNEDLMKKSFYQKGYTFEESLKIKNQILDLLGISFKNKKSIFSFPEQRIESDAFSFWDAYKNTLRNQIPKNAKFTNDLDNGFNSSLFR
tara:strand:- start:919 stop:1368 length:450 start_codon:yes stop_codon:yes gene_type:complete